MESIELRAIQRGNGFISARIRPDRDHALPDGSDVARMFPHGLRPEWNGAGCYHAIKWLCGGR